jgi:4-amino-4-deoxy-L-arabinose transferase-like glycosyltransferase
MMLLKKIPARINFLLRDRRSLLIAGLLAVILLAGTFLRFYRLGAEGVGNTYYAAAVKSMLMSWHNFFFVAFEPGGSISLDKPPVGFWVQALSAYILGLNGFALALPNAIAGVLSIAMIYKLVRHPFGPWAGLVGALALAIMPVAIATERNNTIDGLLVFVLLLAAWAFLKSVYSGRIRWLFLGALLVGLGFNIKMLQAFMPLPAFYVLYFFGMKQKWWKKLLHLFAATILLLGASFSWAVAVDMVPATDRPYVDSTVNNTVMELVFGHNGIERLINLRQSLGFDDGRDGLFGSSESSELQSNPPGVQDIPHPPSDSMGGPGGLPGGNPPQITGGEGFSQGGTGGGFQPGGPSGSMDFGTSGTLRLFTEPLVGEASWLLPFGLGGLILLAIVLWKQPFGDRQISILLWAGWLLPEIVFFSYSKGLLHSYYLIMLGAPLAALVAMTVWALGQLIHKNTWLGFSLVFLLAGGTLCFQMLVLWGTMNIVPRLVGAAACFFLFGLIFLAFSLRKVRLAPVAIGLILGALLVAPAAWSVATTFNTANDALPAAGPAQQSPPRGYFSGNFDGGASRLASPLPVVAASGSQTLLDYLLANTPPDSYLVATDRANDAATYILATGRPVLAIGGFLGEHEEVSTDQIAALVDSGMLRFILGDSLQQYQDISQWVQQNCKSVDTTALAGMSTPGFGGFGDRSASSLYDCVGKFKDR